jgi:tight adherence protein C
MLSVFDIVVFVIGMVLLAVWLIFYLVGLKHADLFDALEENDYPFKEVYFVGYAIMEMLRYQYKSKHDRKLRKEIGVLYGEKYADYYIRVIYAQKVTLGFTVLLLAVPMYGFANDILAAAVVVMFAAVAYYYFGTVTETKILKRSEEMLSDFSNVVSKLALLTNAGMIMREAWEDVAFTGDTALYKEMQIAVEQMKNGVSDVDAMYHFGVRCVVPEIKKFTSTIVQGMVKGNSELTMMLQDQSKEVWAIKKQNVRRQGEKASSKLMIPMMMMFVGILVMVIIPIFANMGV